MSSVVDTAIRINSFTTQMESIPTSSSSNTANSDNSFHSTTPHEIFSSSAPFQPLDERENDDLANDDSNQLSNDIGKENCGYASDSEVSVVVSSTVANENTTIPSFLTSFKLYKASFTGREKQCIVDGEKLSQKVSLEAAPSVIPTHFFVRFAPHFDSRFVPHFAPRFSPRCLQKGALKLVSKCGFATESRFDTSNHKLKMTPPPSWPNPGSAIRTLSGQPRTFSSVKALVQYATQLQKYVGGETGEVNPSNNADNLDSDEGEKGR